MGRIVAIVKQFFEADDWPYVQFDRKPGEPHHKSGSENPEQGLFKPSAPAEEGAPPGAPILQTWFSGDHGQFNCYAQEREKHEQLLFYSILPVRVPPAKLSLAAEFVTRANFALLSGNFELDYHSGRVRFKTSLDVLGEVLTLGMVKNLVYANVYTFDRYLPGVMRVLYAGLSPHEAAAEVEYSPA